jgi:Family of unknown function (DUF6686)
MECGDSFYYENEFGFARKCNCQEAVHLHFGNVVLLLSCPQLRDFSTYVSEALISKSEITDHDSRCIYLPTRDLALMFTLSYTDLSQLCDILDHTLLMVEVEKMLSTQNNQ